MKVLSLFGLRAAVQQVIDRAQNPKEQKRIKIAIDLIAIQAFACIGVAIFAALLTGTVDGYYFTSVLIGLTILVAFLILKGYYRITLAFDLISLNILLFFLSQRLGSESGINYYYVAVGASAFTIYGYEEWKTGILMGMLSLILFILSETVSAEFIPHNERFSSAQLGYLSVVNSALTFFISAYCIVMMLKINYDSEKGMLEKQAIIEHQNEELKKANTELDRFVYSASHDLRAPLSSISGLITIMEKEKGSNDAQYIALIKDRVKAMDVFIKEIVDYSRNSRLEPELKEINLPQLTQEIVKSLAYFENAKDIKVRMNVPENFTVHSDNERLRIVLNNLLTNSMKYADLSKEEPFVEVNAARKDAFVLIEIKDNGIGISETHQSKVFDMFYRGTDRSKGSGLGLYIAKEVVQKLGGKISMRSAITEGSMFTIELPAS